MSELPKEWADVSLEEVVIYKKGTKPKILIDQKKDGFIPYIDIRAFEKNEIRQFADVGSSKIATKNDILVVWDGARCGLAGMGKEGAIGSTIMCLTPIELHPKYLYHFLRTEYDNINSDNKGTGIPHVKPELFWNLQVPLASLNEQKRIVEKLDKLLSRVEETKERLEKIPVIIKRFRQSVLNAAVTGELTKDWRGKNPGSENNIIQELKSFTDELGLDEKGWYFTKIENVYSMFSGGTPSRSVKDYWTGKISWVSSGDVKSNVMYEGSEFITKEGLENSSAKLCPVDSVIVVVRSGILKHTLPVSLVKKEFAINQDIKCLDSGNKKLNHWLHLFLQGNAFEILSLNREGTTVQSVKSETLKNYEIAFPSMEEQKEIFKRLNTLFKKADEIEDRYKKAKAYVDKLTQSILAKAFRGELVPQDPNDEPADKLLERIKAEKEKQITEKGKKKQDKEKVVKEIIKKHHKAMKKLN